MSDFPDLREYLKPSNIYLKEEELENAVLLVLNSYRSYNQFKEAACLKALLHSLKHKKLDIFAKMCLNYLREHDPEVGKLVENFVKENAVINKTGDGEFLSSVGIQKFDNGNNVK